MHNEEHNMTTALSTALTRRKIHTAWRTAARDAIKLGHAWSSLPF